MRNSIQPGGKARRVVELAKVLVGLQENVLRQVQSIFAVGGDAQQVVIDTLLPPGNEEVIALHITAGCLPNQVGILDRPKDQSLAPCLQTQYVPKKSIARYPFSLTGFTNRDRRVS